MTTLILCSAMPDALSFYREAAGRGEKAVASSSLPYDESAKHYETWEWLPSVYEENFLTALNTLIARHQITRIFCPHNIAHYTLLQLKKEGKLALPLIGAPPIIMQTEAMGRLMQEAREAEVFIRQITGGETLSLPRIAAVLRQTDLTFGESNVSKLMAMMAVFQSLPKGDVVEVGSWWGKTATALAMLARFFGTGSVLCADPWESEGAVQKGSSALMQSMPGITDWETVFAGFTVHTTAVAGNGQFNYLRLPSIKAEKVYGTKTPITSPEFGSVKYSGKIALIHIDGNHDYDSVREDYAAWRPHVMKGGMVILDDYVWLHGDGPKRLGDEVLEKEQKQIAASFIAGKALFIRYA